LDGRSEAKNVKPKGQTVAVHWNAQFSFACPKRRKPLIELIDVGFDEGERRGAGGEANRELLNFNMNTPSDLLPKRDAGGLSP